MLKAKDIPFGIRNNNPGNVIWTKDAWLGLDNPSMVVSEHSGRSFFRFKTPSDGIRCIARLVRKYFDERRSSDGTRVDTVWEICERWESGNQDKALHYEDFMVHDTGYSRNQSLDLHNYATMRKIVIAIIRFENGTQPYTDEVIDRGLMKAGYTPPPKPLSVKKSKTTQGTVLAGGSAVLAYMQESGWAFIDKVKEFMPMLHGNVGKVILGIAAVGVMWILWDKWNERRSEGQ